MPPANVKKTASSAAKTRDGRTAGGTARAAGVSKKASGGERKRVQNRIAQQCLRERRAASSRHMDNMLEAISFATEGDQSQRYALLLDAHLKLIKENQTMEDALFRLRKKLLSLSSAAAMAADDAVVEEIMGKKQREPSPESSDMSKSGRRSSSSRGPQQKQNNLTQIVTGFATPLTVDIMLPDHDEQEPTGHLFNNLEDCLAYPGDSAIDEYLNTLPPPDITANPWFESLPYSQSQSSSTVIVAADHKPGPE